MEWSTMADGVLDIFRFGFMQRALIAGLLVAVVCGLLGVFVVLRRTAPLGDALAHVSFGGVSLGLFLGIFPLYIALLVAALGGVAIHLLRERKLYGELSLMIVQAAGIGGGVVLVSMSGGLTVDLLSFLFGGILTVTWSDIHLIVLILSASLAVLVLLFKEFFLVTFDPEGARVSGIPVRWLDVGFTVMTALAVVLAMRVVGILLVSALLVIPAAAALQFRAGLRSTLVVSVVIAALSVVAGLVMSYVIDTATGGMIVLVTLIGLIASLAVSGVGSRARAPVLASGSKV
jgi:zinc transport system permease protein